MMDLKVIVTVLLFLSVYVALAANQRGDSPSSDIRNDATLDNSVGIRSKRGLLKEGAEFGSKLITGAGKFITRTRLRVQQAEEVLLKDAIHVKRISPTANVYTKPGGVGRAQQDFLNMNVYRGTGSERKRIMLATTGKYAVVYRKADPRCQPPSPSIDMWRPASSGDGYHKVFIIYTDKPVSKLDSFEYKIKL